MQKYFESQNLFLHTIIGVSVTKRNASSFRQWGGGGGGGGGGDPTPPGRGGGGGGGGGGRGGISTPSLGYWY